MLSQCQNGEAHHPSPEGGSTSGDRQILPVAAAEVAPHLQRTGYRGSFFLSVTW